MRGFNSHTIGVKTACENLVRLKWNIKIQNNVIHEIHGIQRCVSYYQSFSFQSGIGYVFSRHRYTLQNKLFDYMQPAGTTKPRNEIRNYKTIHKDTNVHVGYTQVTKETRRQYNNE